MIRLFRAPRALEGALAAALALGLALVGISGWNLSLSVPFEISWDSFTGQSLVKGVLDNGWHLTNDWTGAPFGADWHDFPESDNNLHFLLIKALGLLSGDHVVVFNLFWLLTFPLTALAGWWVLRDLGLPAIAAVTCAVIYALLPYHFWRGEGHVLLSGYYAVPLACWLVLRVLARRPFGRLSAEPGDPLRSRLRGSPLLAAAFCLTIGSTGIYYAAFAVLLLAFSALVVAWDREGRRPAIEALAAAALIGLVLVLNLLPSLAYRAENGKNEIVAAREAGESEQYGLSLIGMLLPRDGHRVEELASWKESFLAHTPTPGEGASLGLIASAGLVFCFFFLFRSVLARPPGRGPPYLSAAATAAVLAFLIGTVGGVSSIFARTVGPELRSWNRISIFIAFFALVAVGWGLAGAAGRLRERPGAAGRVLPVAAMAAVLALAVWDQAGPVRENQFDGDFTERQWEPDEAFVEELEAELPDGAAVLQLPYLKFPEGYPVPGAMIDHDHFRGYLHSESLRWSYGAMKGRSADVLACLREAPMPIVADAARAWGFDAVWVDRLGYFEASPRIEQDLEASLDTAPLRSDDERFAVFPVERGVTSARVRALEEALPADEDGLQDCGAIAAAAGVPEVGPG